MWFYTKLSIELNKSIISKQEIFLLLLFLLLKVVFNLQSTVLNVSLLCPRGEFSIEKKIFVY